MISAVEQRLQSAGWLWRALVHLRLSFNYILSPLFVWGTFATAGEFGPRFWLGFVAFHVFLYGGTNAFNSYYDRDEGPIGGLERPPQVDRSLLYCAVVMKAVGLLLALLVGPGFCVCYVLFVVYSVTYSHPAFRIKRKPIASAASVFVLQGIVGAVAGALAGGATAAALTSTVAIVACLAGATLVLAVYPLTQVYQTAEDADRGDLTLARWLGAARVLSLSAALFAAGMLGVWFVYWQRGLWPETGIIPLFALAAIAMILWLKCNLSVQSAESTYRRVMTFNYLNSTVLLLMMGLRASLVG